jgi:cardiolipin synthase
VRFRASVKGCAHTAIVRSTLRALLDPRAIPTERVGLPMRVSRAWRRTVDRLLPLGGSSEGNQITPFFDGDDVYEAMLAAIKSAQRRVWLETYIFTPDRVGKMFVEALLEARARGVEVVVIYDSVGSTGMHTDNHWAPLHEAGARVVAFNPPFQIGRKLPLLYRDHRKILIVDDSVGFTGGMNISEDYAGPRLGTSMFRDTQVLVEGPAVRDLGLIFAASFHTATGERLELSARCAPLAEGVFCQVLGSDVRRRKRHIQRAMFHTVGRCVRTCYVTSPYFVPPPRLLSALERAAQRGVDVRVLTAGFSDVPIVAIAGRHLYERLLRAGVKIYEMKGRTLHAKTTTIDGLYAAIGSFNLDRWSFARNLEVNLSTIDPGVAQGLEAQFHKDLAISTEVQLDVHMRMGPLDRIFRWLAFQLMRI